MGNKAQWPLRFGQGREALRDLIALLPSAGRSDPAPAGPEPQPSAPLSVDELTEQLTLLLKRRT